MHHYNILSPTSCQQEGESLGWAGNNDKTLFFL